MIIDVHGHYTTAPKQLQRFRDAQLAALESGSAAPSLDAISDDELRDSVEDNQLRILRERGAAAVERGQLGVAEPLQLLRRGRVVTVDVDDHRGGSCST